MNALENILINGNRSPMVYVRNSLYDEFVQAFAMDAEESKLNNGENNWKTTKKGNHFKVDDNETIEAGFGGKFNGQHISALSKKKDGSSQQKTEAEKKKEEEARKQAEREAKRKRIHDIIRKDKVARHKLFKKLENSMVDRTSARFVVKTAVWFMKGSYVYKKDGVRMPFIIGSDAVNESKKQLKGKTDAELIATAKRQLYGLEHFDEILTGNHNTWHQNEGEYSEHHAGDWFMQIAKKLPYQRKTTVFCIDLRRKSKGTVTTFHNSNNELNKSFGRKDESLHIRKLAEDEVPQFYMAGFYSFEI